MPENHKKGSHYLATILGKAWEDVSFIEVFSEAIGGFVLSVIALIKGWIGWDSAYEIIFECVGCAILIPLVGFVLRLLLVAPAELVKESTERRKKEEINPKSVYPSIVIALLGVCSILVFCLFLALRVDVAKFRENSKATESEKKELPKQAKVPSKPLPETILPRPEPPPQIMSTQGIKVASVETPKQMETFEVSTGAEGEGWDLESRMAKMAKIKADKKAREDADAAIERDRIIKDIQKWWDVYLPHYKHAMVVLHDALRSEAEKIQDGIAQSDGYFQSLPPSIDSKVGEFTVAEISFQKNTNMDFLVKIAALNQSNHRSLIITATGCRLEFEAEFGNGFRRTLHIDPDFDDFKHVEIDRANDLMRDAIGDIIAARKYSLTVTNFNK